jgi:hypothetical protein
LDQNFPAQDEQIEWLTFRAQGLPLTRFPHQAQTVFPLSQRQINFIMKIRLVNFHRSWGVRARRRGTGVLVIPASFFSCQKGSNRRRLCDGKSKELNFHPNICPPVRPY